MTRLIAVFRNFANARKDDTESRRGVIRPSDLYSTSVDTGTLKVVSDDSGHSLRVSLPLDWTSSKNGYPTSK